MKRIDPAFTTVKKTVCPFCNYGCEFGVVFDDFGVKQVEYIKEGSSGGRLCPRGSAAAFYLNHPRRLTMPTRNGNTIEWPKVIKEFKKIIARPDNVAVTFDRNFTLEEYELIKGFCAETGIENIASTYFEPETFLRKFSDKPFNNDDIDNAQMIIVLGDLFNQTPMISKSIINWKLNNRRHRLVVIDTIGTHTAAFANDFLKCKLGTEPLVLLALAGEDVEGVDVPSVTGISEAQLIDIRNNFKDAKHGLIFACIPFAHTYDSLLLTEAISRLSDYANKRVVPLVEFTGFEGKQHFGSLIDLVKKKKIKQLINFGELFPFYYPQLVKSLRALSIYSTSTLKYNGYTVLPAALNLEKVGSISTIFGKKTLAGTVEPASGARTVSELIALIKEIKGNDKPVHAPEINIDLKARVEKLLNSITTPRKKKALKLIGEKIAYNFLSFFEKERIKINPQDAQDLGIKENDMVSIKSKHGEVELAAKISPDVDSGVAAVPTETPGVKGLFEYEIDNNNVVNFIPTEVTIWRKG
jgi:anaerobic selenocysteine-containing dehydrogenase